MRLLSVFSLFPPNLIDGAERSAHGPATSLKKAEHDVVVASIAASEEKMSGPHIESGLRILQLHMPRPSQTPDFLPAPGAGGLLIDGFNEFEYAGKLEEVLDDRFLYQDTAINASSKIENIFSSAACFVKYLEVSCNEFEEGRR